VVCFAAYLSLTFGVHFDTNAANAWVVAVIVGCLFGRSCIATPIVHSLTLPPPPALTHPAHPARRHRPRWADSSEMCSSGGTADFVPRITASVPPPSPRPRPLSCTDALLFQPYIAAVYAIVDFLRVTHKRDTAEAILDSAKPGVIDPAGWVGSPTKPNQPAQPPAPAAPSAGAAPAEGGEGRGRRLSGTSLAPRSRSVVVGTGPGAAVITRGPSSRAAAGALSAIVSGPTRTHL
jgi:hypothetical protein